MSSTFKARIMSDETSVRIAITRTPSIDATARFLHFAKVHRVAARVCETVCDDKRAERWSANVGTAPVVVIALGPKGDVRLARDVAAAACVLEQVEIVRDASTEHLFAARGATVVPVPVGAGLNPMHLLAAPGTFDDEPEECEDNACAGCAWCDLHHP